MSNELDNTKAYEEKLSTGEVIQEDIVQVVPSVEVAEAPITRRSLPDFFDVSRDISSKYSQIEKEFFSIVRHQGKLTYNRNTLSNLIFALCEKLSDDSYLRGKKDALTGRAINLEDGIPLTITMQEILENGYGVEEGNSAQRTAIKDLLLALNSTPLPVFQNDPFAFEMLLNVRGGRYHNNKRGEKIFFKLTLNTTFSKYALDSYGRHPKGIKKKLVQIAGQNITAMDSPLLLLLGQQRKDKAYPMKKVNLWQYLDIYEAYKKNPKEYKVKLDALFERMKAVGVLIKVNEDDENYYFILNKDYGSEKILIEKKNGR